MDLLIVTGLSGAGKTQAIHALEDIDYFCIDNIPAEMLGQFMKLCEKSAPERRIAVGIDIRCVSHFGDFNDAKKKLADMGCNVKTLYLDAADDVLIRRFKETRRKHPLEEAAGGDLSKAIDAEMTLLTDIRACADYIIDSSLLTSRQLQEQVSGLFLENPSDRMLVSCMSFGFMYGVPGEADLVFDVRCLPNPFYVPELKKLTGLDEAVRDFVMKYPQSVEFEKKIFDMAEFLLPLYVSEGKSRLVIAFGCTGGKHRSVTLASHVYKTVVNLGYKAKITHRDISKGK